MFSKENKKSEPFSYRENVRIFIVPEEHRPIGKYGRMHREYLREVHPARLNTLILTGELWTYLADLNEQAQERLDTIMEQMKATEGVTEELKRTSQMEWVQRCNNIHNRAEEIVLHAEKVNGVWEQRLRIHYNCVGTIEIPSALPLPTPDVSVNTRKGVVVNYAPCDVAI